MASHVAHKTNILHASSTPPTQAQIAHDILPQPPADALTPSIEQLIAQNPDNIADVINSTEAIHAAMRVGDMHLMGLTHGMFNFAGWLRDALEIIHVNAGLPWWGTIALAAGVMRLALFPLVARMHGNNARMQVIAPQQQVIMTKIQDASKRGDKAAQMIYSQELRKLWEKNNCSPFRTMLLPMVQVPLFMTFFFAIRGMTSLPVPQLKEGGLLWFTDLVAADPYYILPTTSMLLTLAVLEVRTFRLSRERSLTIFSGRRRWNEPLYQQEPSAFAKWYAIRHNRRYSLYRIYASGMSSATSRATPLTPITLRD